MSGTFLLIEFLLVHDFSLLLNILLLWFENGFVWYASSISFIIHSLLSLFNQLKPVFSCTEFPPQNFNSTGLPTSHFGWHFLFHRVLYIFMLIKNIDVKNHLSFSCLSMRIVPFIFMNCPDLKTGLNLEQLEQCVHLKYFWLKSHIKQLLVAKCHLVFRNFLRQLLSNLISQILRGYFVTENTFVDIWSYFEES